MPSLSLFVLDLLLMMLLVGTMFGISLAFNPAGLSPATYVEMQQHMIRALNTLLPGVGGACILLTAALAVLARDDTASRNLLIGALASLVTAGLITRLANQPINSEVMTWRLGSLPDNWSLVRDTWWQWHITRTIAATTALVLVLATNMRTARGHW